MKRNSLFRVGLIGTVIVALCCFTPVLVVALTAAGLASLVPKIDSFLIPMLGACAAFTFWAFTRREKD